MTKPRAVLEAMEATLEGGKEAALASFAELGMRPNTEPEAFEPPAGWDIADRALFHYVRGNYGLYRLSDSYLNRSIADFGEAFNTLVVAKDAARATRAFARLLRECAYASFSLANVFDVASPMMSKLDWMRANAPRRDVEELDLSIVEMITRMAREGGASDRGSLGRAFGLVRATLTRLFDQPLTRQRALPHAITGFWLGNDALWTDDDLAEPRTWYGDDGLDREQLRRAAYFKACELEDGSFYRVGAATPTKDRKQRDLAKHFAHLLTQYATLRDEAASQAAITRWGKELGGEVVAAAMTQAARDATPAPVTPAPEPKRAKKPTDAPEPAPAKKPINAPEPARAKKPTDAPEPARAKKPTDAPPPAAAEETPARAKKPTNPPPDDEKPLRAKTPTAPPSPVEARSPKSDAGATSKPVATASKSSSVARSPLPASTSTPAASKPAAAKSSSVAAARSPQPAATSTPASKPATAKATTAKPAAKPAAASKIAPATKSASGETRSSKAATSAKPAASKPASKPAAKPAKKGSRKKSR